MSKRIYQSPADIEIYVPDQGIILKDQAVFDGNSLFEYGRPVRPDQAAHYMRRLLIKAFGHFIIKPNVVVCHPADYTEEDRKMCRSMMTAAGAKEVHMYPGSLESFLEDAPEGFLEVGGYKGVITITQDPPVVCDDNTQIKEKMHSGALYLPGDEALLREQTVYLDMLYDFNQTRPIEGEKRQKMLKEMFAEFGEGCYIEPPFHANFGGHHVHFGHHVYANFNLTLVDDTHIYVGDHTMFGPNVTVATAGHPISPELREKEYQQNKPVHIGKNCWIGAGAIILPGVTIGDNTVIGAGSIVTKDIPPNVVAVGNPCRVLREIDES